MQKTVLKASRRIPAALVLVLGLLLSLSLAAPAAPAYGQPVQASTPEYQFLTNPGMEAYDAPYTEYQGIDCQVASGWQRFWYAGPEPQWMDTRVFAGSHLGAGWVERIQGETSQLVISTQPYTAGLLQRVNGLTPGTGYGFHAAMLTIFQTSAPPASHGTMIKQVGMDPTGGLDPQASTVIWSEPDDHDEGPWDIDQRTAVVAQGPAMTVFIRVISPHPAGDLPFLNYSFLDSAILAQTPTVQASSPAASQSPTFTVRWDNAQPAPGGGYVRWYDVQWLDEFEGVWHDWLERTKAVEASFTGTEGHTYLFRARAWQRYPNGAHLYGPYRPEGDTVTRVQGPRLAGRVLTSAGNPLAGATVSIAGTSYATVSRPDGGYLLDVEPWADPHSAAVSHPWWGPPDPRHGLTFGLGETVAFTWTLPPPDDAVANGGFESGLTSWTPSNAQGQAATIVSNPVRTGYQALALGATTGASQTVALTGAWEPVLSLWYQPGPGAADPGAAFNVKLSITADAAASAPALAETTVLTPTLGVTGWQHLAHRLGPPGRAFSGKVTLLFQSQAGAVQSGDLVYLDEVSLGSGPGGPYRLFLPFASRRASGP